MEAAPYWKLALPYTLRNDIGKKLYVIECLAMVVVVVVAWLWVKISI